MIGNTIEHLIIIPLVIILVISLITLMIYAFTFSLEVMHQHYASLLETDYQAIKTPFWQYSYEYNNLQPSKLNNLIGDVYYYLLLYKERLSETGDY